MGCRSSPAPRPLPRRAAFRLLGCAPWGIALLSFLPCAFLWLFSALVVGLGGDTQIQSFAGLLLPDRNPAVCPWDRCLAGLVLALSPFSGNVHLWFLPAPAAQASPHLSPPHPLRMDTLLTPTPPTPARSPARSSRTRIWENSSVTDGSFSLTPGS